VFQEYLRQFPDGTFAGLAKIYIKEYSKNDSIQSEDVAKQEEAQASLVGTRKQDFMADSRRRVAILPGCLRKIQFFPKAGMHRATFWDAVGKALSEQKIFIPVYSNFELGYKHEANRIDDNILTHDVRMNLCIKPMDNYFKEPNLDLVCRLGNQLDVDVIMMYSIVRGGKKRHNIKLFLIDVKTKAIYSKKGAITSADNMWKDVNNFTRNTLYLYEKEAPRP